MVVNIKKNVKNIVFLIHSTSVIELPKYLLLGNLDMGQSKFILMICTDDAADRLLALGFSFLPTIDDHCIKSNKKKNAKARTDDKTNGCCPIGSNVIIPHFCSGRSY